MNLNIVRGKWRAPWAALASVVLSVIVVTGCASFEGELGGQRFSVRFGRCRAVASGDLYKGSELFRGRHFEVYTDPSGTEWVRLPGHGVIYEVGPPPPPAAPTRAILADHRRFDARPWDAVETGNIPAEAGAPIFAGEMDVEFDETIDYASISYVLPAKHVAYFVNPDTTPFDVVWTTAPAKDGLRVTYTGALHAVAGAALSQGIHEISGVQPGVGLVTVELDAAESLAIISVNGALLPDEERPFRAIWSDDAP